MDEGSYTAINSDGPQNSNVLIVKRSKRASVEFIMFAFFLAKTLSDAVVINLLERQCCIVSLGIDPSNCSEPLSDEVKVLVQPLATNFSMVRSLIEAIIPCILSLFIGPWSDVNGRRPFLLLTLAGYTCSYALWAALSVIPNIHPGYFLLASIPTALTGGLVAVFITILCYISDTSKPEDRGVRMGMVEAACVIGVTCALLLTSYLINLANIYGFVIIFVSSAALLFLTLLYTYFFVEESVNILETEVKKTRIFDSKHVKGILNSCFKARPNHGRLTILLIVFTLAIAIFLLDGDMAVLYLSSQKRFNWKLEEYTLYSAFALAAMGVFALGGIYIFTKVLRWPEMVLTLVGTICRTLSAAIIALATEGWYLYVASVVSAIGGIVGPLGRSSLSQLVSSEEIGKIFAFTSFMEALAPLAATPLYSLVYDATLVTHPSAVFWMSTVISSVSVLAIGGVVFIQWKTPKETYSVMREESEPNSSSVIS